MTRQSRSQRWANSCAAAEAALQSLLDIQSEYQEWKENLPENLEDSPVGEKLDEVCDLEIQSALDMVQDANALDLPQGFGRD